MDKKILIVDDAMFMRRIISQILNSGGYDSLIEASDGEEAVREYKKCQPDLVLLDITMPGKSGIDVLKELLAYDRKAKVVMCTSSGQEKAIRMAKSLGAADYIVKPFKEHNFLETINKAIG